MKPCGMQWVSRFSYSGLIGIFFFFFFSVPTTPRGKLRVTSLVFKSVTEKVWCAPVVTTICLSQLLPDRFRLTCQSISFCCICMYDRRDYHCVFACVLFSASTKYTRCLSLWPSKTRTRHQSEQKPERTNCRRKIRARPWWEKGRLHSILRKTHQLRRNP